MRRRAITRRMPSRDDRHIHFSGRGRVHNPIVGQVPQVEGLYLAAGHEGLGTTMAPITGQLICQALTGQPTVVPFGDPGAPLNKARAPMARAASGWDLRDADAAPEIALNRAIWQSVKGRGSRMPAPRNARIAGSRVDQ